MERGGLSHVNNATYCAFLSMELELRKHISLNSAHKVNEDFKKRVLKSIIENEDVLFHWAVVATDWEEEEAAALLELVAAFVSSWMEIQK